MPAYLYTRRLWLVIDSRYLPMHHFDSWQALVAVWHTMLQQQQRRLLVLPETPATYQQVLPCLVAASSLDAIGVNLQGQELGPEAAYIKPNQAKQMLGLNRGLLVYRGVDEFNVSAFSALCGTLVGGSFAVLIVPAEGDWAGHADQQSRDYGCPDGHGLQPFKSWWQQVWQTSDGVLYLSHGAQQEAAHGLLNAAKAPTELALGQAKLNQQQQHLVDQVLALQFVHGRVVWASGPRGRGKSFAMARAMNQLAALGQRCVITASASHNSRLVGCGQGQYCALDKLLTMATTNVDILFVEEASSMPLALLQQLLEKFAKVVLLSTVDGYEGTGQGLQLKLPGLLDKLALEWQQVNLHEPLRWQPNDALEQLIEDSFLPRQLSKITDNLVLEQLQVKVLKGAELIKQKDLLYQVYSLLALAHYQTTPHDLRLLLDHPQLTLHLYCQANSGQLCGLMCVMQEGLMDADLCQQVAQGHRRVKGQLLPQILAQQAGVAQMAEASILRVQRIAVHPQLQGQGLGSYMLTQLRRWGQEQQADYLGSSFAAEPAVVKFWLQAGYQAVWGGMRADAASGLPSLQVLMPIKAQPTQLLALRQHWFFYTGLLRGAWPAYCPAALQVNYQGVPVSLVTQLVRQVGLAHGNAYAVHAYVLQWLLGQPKLTSLQRQWLALARTPIKDHKPYVAMTRQLLHLHMDEFILDLENGLLGIKVVEHPLGS